MIRRAVIDKNRIDILCTEVLGYEVQPFHLAMMRFQFLHPDNLQIAWRGSGKSTCLTVARCIFMLIIDRDLRILLASKNKSNCEGFLKEIKHHFENNEKLIRIFGEFYDSRRCPKWDTAEIEILGRKSPAKEASITCVSVESAVVSKHYHVAIDDDLIDEDNSRTKHTRERVRTWAYQTLDPTILPPEPGRRFVGEHHRHGTRYHFDDYYAHLINNELKAHHQIIPALNEKNQSAWPERFSPAWLLRKKLNSGAIIFGAQYLGNTDAMKGEIFQYDDCQQLGEDEWPDESALKIFVGVDLAVKAEEQNDSFAVVVVGVLGKVMCGREPDAVFVLDWYEGKLRFPQQRPKMLEFYDRYDPIGMGVEANAYQLAAIQDLEMARPGIRVTKLHTDKDKLSRAWKLSSLFEAKKVFFKKGVHGPLIDRLILFPNIGKDVFDALDHAVLTSKQKKRRSARDRQERREPGVIGARQIAPPRNLMRS